MEAVELDAAGDGDDAGFVLLAGGGSRRPFGASWAGPVGAFADEESRTREGKTHREIKRCLKRSIAPTPTAPAAT
ncbi:MAG: hypothetical protein LC776_12365 [Acidobacteria bacterium]|nr:hypothetical protein [Acidobacteriota bacterium]